MTRSKPAPCTVFGRLDTWIVDLQFSEGAERLDSPDVNFNRHPENPADPNAVAVFNRKSQHIGYLPAYDAAHLSPLIEDETITLLGKAFPAEEEDRYRLELEIHATPKAAEILAFDPNDDWRAIYHNLFAVLWPRLDEYSPSELKEFRNRFRPLAHQQGLYPKTQFLYRMLKARIIDIENETVLRLREQVLAAVSASRFGRAAGWPEMSVHALYPSRAPSARTAVREPAGRTEFRGSEAIRQLPSRCPYPSGACGAAIVVGGDWFSLDWFDSPEIAQVHWYPLLLSGVEAAQTGRRLESGDEGRAMEDVKAEILKTLSECPCAAPGSGTDRDGASMEFLAEELHGTAHFCDAELTRLHLRARRLQA